MSDSFTNSNKSTLNNSLDIGALFGRGIAFPPRIGPDGRWAWSEGPQSIRESIQIILQTEVGERIMLHPFGAGLGRFLFETNNAATARLLRERVENALRLWEPRINLRRVEVESYPASADAAPSESGISQSDEQVTITIEYELIATQTTEQMALLVSLRG